jgi:hypothetical protein
MLGPGGLAALVGTFLYAQRQIRRGFQASERRDAGRWIADGLLACSNSDEKGYQWAPAVRTIASGAKEKSACAGYPLAPVAITRVSRVPAICFCRQQSWAGQTVSECRTPSVAVGKPLATAIPPLDGRVAV